MSDKAESKADVASVSCVGNQKYMRSVDKLVSRKLRLQAKQKHPV